MNPTQRPLGLSLLTWFLWFLAGAALLVLVVMAVGDGPVLLGGQAFPRQDAVAMVLPILAPMALAAAGAALALSLDRHWARPAILLPFALAAVAPAFTGAATSVVELLGAAAMMAPLLAALAWYLYGRRGVREHFARLRAGRQDRAARVGNGPADGPA